MCTELPLYFCISHDFVGRGTNKAEAFLTTEYTRPGRYTVHLPVAPPEEFLLVVGLTNEHGLYFEDSLPVAVGTRFYVWMKYLVAAPVAILCIPLFLFRQKKKI